MVQNLQFLRSLNAGSKPASLTQGQIAFNLPDKLLFVGDGSDVITDKSGVVTGSAIDTSLGFFESDLSILTALGAANSYTDQKIADLVDSAPALLDTLNELAAAIGDDSNFVATVTNAVANVQTNLNTESARATGAESQLALDLAAANNRALAAEGQLAADLSAESARALAAESALGLAAAAALDSETQRALAAESALSNRISDIENGIDLGTYDAPSGGGGGSSSHSA